MKLTSRAALTCWLVTFAMAVTACSSSNPVLTPQMPAPPRPPTGGPAPTSASISVPLTSSATALPTVGGAGGTIAFALTGTP